MHAVWKAPKAECTPQVVVQVFSTRCCWLRCCSSRCCSLLLLLARAAAGHAGVQHALLHALHLFLLPTLAQLLYTAPLKFRTG